jgi:hypothetical protein
MCREGEGPDHLKVLRPFWRWQRFWRQLDRSSGLIYEGNRQGRTQSTSSNYRNGKLLTSWSGQCGFGFRAGCRFALNGGPCLRRNSQRLVCGL